MDRRRAEPTTLAESGRLHFPSRGFRSVRAGLFHPVKGFSSGFLDLVLQRVSRFAHALGYSACAIIHLSLEAVAVFANPLVLEVGCLERARNRSPDGKAYGAKY